MALYRERRNSSTILVVNCLSELNICWDLHGLHRRLFKSQQMLGSEKWDPTKLWWWMIWEVLVCRASNIFSRSCLQRWMTLRFGNACRRAFQEHWSNCAHWMWAELSVHIQCAFDVTVTCLNKWLFFKDWIGCGGLHAWTVSFHRNVGGQYPEDACRKFVFFPSSWHCPPLRWLAWPLGYRRSETQHFLDHCWLVSFKVCTFTGFHSAVVQECSSDDNGCQRPKGKLLWLWRCECRAHELKMATPLLWDLPPWLLMRHSVDHLEVSIMSCGGKSRHRGVANFNWDCRNYACKWWKILDFPRSSTAFNWGCGNQCSCGTRNWGKSRLVEEVLRFASFVCDNCIRGSLHLWI